MPTPRMTAPKKPAARTTRRKVTPPTGLLQSTVPLTEAQKQAQLEAYMALKTAGLPIPDTLAHVETEIHELRVAQEQAHAQREEEAAQRREVMVSEANEAGPWFIRNGYPAPFNLRLDRQTEARRIQLQARGTPGDMHPLKDEDLKDPVLKRNLLLGVIEVIPAGEAALVMEKQTTNMHRRVHAPLATLRNEKGHEYPEDAVKVEAEFNQQGVTVARVEEGVLSGQVTDKQLGGTRSTGGITRVQSGFVPTGGNPAIIQYGPMGNDAAAQAADTVARRTDIQGPGAGLGDIKVVVEPVQRS